MKDGLKKNGKGGANENVKDMSNLHQPSVLQHGVSRVIRLTMTLSDEGKKELDNDDDVLNGFCLYAIENFWTKGDGCTKNMDYWGGTTTGVKDGKAELKHGDKNMGTLEVTYA